MYNILLQTALIFLKYMGWVGGKLVFTLFVFRIITLRKIAWVLLTLSSFWRQSRTEKLLSLIPLLQNFWTSSAHSGVVESLIKDGLTDFCCGIFPASCTSFSAWSPTAKLFLLFWFAKLRAGGAWFPLSNLFSAIGSPLPWRPWA